MLVEQFHSDSITLVCALLTIIFFGYFFFLLYTIHLVLHVQES